MGDGYKRLKIKRHTGILIRGFLRHYLSVCLLVPIKRLAYPLKLHRDDDLWSGSLADWRENTDGRRL